MSNKRTIDEGTGRKGNTAGKEGTKAQAGEQEEENRSKLASKSKDITRTLMRRTSRDITPVSKKTSKREQSAAKKSCQARKQGLMAYFGEGSQVQPPTMEGTPIEAVTMQRTPKSSDSASKKKRGKADGSKTTGRKKLKLDNKDSQPEEVIDLEKMEKMPLKAKGTKGSGEKNKTKKDRGKNTPDSVGKKKATFAETVGKEEVKEKEMEYKTCVVSFAIWVDKTKDPKGGFTKKLLEGLAFMQNYIDQHASFHPIRPSKAFKPIKEKGNMPKYQVTLQNYFCISNTRAFDNINANGG
jgi:hypothetical protein